jgi:hypothetical protein
MRRTYVVPAVEPRPSFSGGPGSAVALQVHADRWEYWTAPNKLGQMAGMAKAFLMDTQPDIGDSGTIET